MPNIIDPDFIGATPMKGPLLDERGLSVWECRRELTRNREQASGIFLMLGIIAGATAILSLFVSVVKGLLAQ